MAINRFLLLFFYFITPWAVYAQGVMDFYRKGNHNRVEDEFNLRLGLNYSQQTITVYDAGSFVPIAILWGVRPKIGFYAGSSYCKGLSLNRLTMRIDATFQMRGVKSVDLNNKPVLNASYFYLGASPQIGVHLTSQLIVYTGLESTILVAKKNSWGQGTLLELGAPMRINYVLGSFKLELGYFRAFTRYDRLKDVLMIGGPFQHDFYNRNWQAGLIYNWGK